MASKFVVGDKVRVVKDDFSEKEHLIGLVGTINRHDPDEDGDQCWFVRFDDGDSNENGDGGWWFTLDEIDKENADDNASTEV